MIERRWAIPLLAILIVLLAAETVILFVFILYSPPGRSTFPGLTIRNVQTGCSTLTWTEQFSTATNRTLFFTCPGMGANSWALRSNPICQGGFCVETPYYVQYRTTPTFTLPAGYLSFWLTPANCDRYHGVTTIQLTNGQEIVVGGTTYLYNYCAVIDNQVSHPGSFTIDWTPGVPPITRPAPFTITASPATMSLHIGETGSLTVTLTSLNSWTGNVQVSEVGGYTLGCCPGQANPGRTLLKPAGTNTTIFSLPTCEYNGTICTRIGSYRVVIAASTDCTYIVQGTCFDQYNSASFALQVIID